jgi:hypothetical protein
VQKDTNKVKLRGTFIEGRQKDLPTLLWFPEMMEHADSFKEFFSRPDNKV